MRRVLVTGANKGIGRAIVEAILQHADDTFVYLGSRDRARGEEAKAALGAAHASRVEVVELDVGDASSVERAKSKVEPLFGLVNNAGVGWSSGLGVRGLVEVNTFGVERVCRTFLPLVDASAKGGGRIVNVTSAAGPSYVAKLPDDQKRFFLDGSISWDRLKSFIDERLAADDVSGEDAYGFSKACTNLYTLILARENPNLRINACTPGFIETDMTRPYAEKQGKPPAAMGMKPPSAGAVAPLHLLFGDLEGNGRYYGSDAKRSPLDRYREPGSAPYTGD
jgi:NAD(P)-dependent dehydrogenase (short-subunit alcohol dehydrogenase family)